MDREAWRTRCFSCMEQLSSEEETCPQCRWDNHNRANGEGMLEQTVLHDQYMVGRALGRGGFGVTYMGFDLNLRRRVAIKEFFPASLAYRNTDTMQVAPYSNDVNEYRNGLRRAYDEGQTVANLGHVPNIVQVYNAFEANGTVYIVMEYINGVTLAQMVRKDGPLSWQRALELMTPIMRALEKVHAKDVIHRDVSPDNIMLNRETDETVLLDFGAARKAGSGLTATLRPGYAPVEQYSEKASQDGRVDEYALCATLYFLMTGKAPESAELRMYAERPLPSPRSMGFDVAPGVEAVLLKGMSVKREDRYPSMAALREAFEAAAGNERPPRLGSSDNAPSGGGARKKQAPGSGPSGNGSSGGARRALATVLTVAILGTAGVVAWNNVRQGMKKDAGDGMSTGEATASPTATASATDGQATTQSPTVALTPTPTPTPTPDVTPEPVLQTGEISDSWDEIIAAIDDGTAKQRYAVGATKALELSGIGAIHMQLAGFDLDERADGNGKATTTWIAVELLPEKHVMNETRTTEGGWRDSDLRAYLQELVYHALSESVRDGLIEVNKKQGIRGGDTQTTKDMVWIPDYAELFGENSLYYSLFQNKHENRVKQWNGSAAWWWLRSAYSNDYYSIYTVYSSGRSNFNGAYTSGGVALGFCL